MCDDEKRHNGYLVLKLLMNIIGVKLDIEVFFDVNSIFDVLDKDVITQKNRFQIDVCT